MNLWTSGLIRCPWKLFRERQPLVSRQACLWMCCTVHVNAWKDDPGHSEKKLVLVFLKLLNSVNCGGKSSMRTHSPIDHCPPHQQGQPWVWPRRRVSWTACGIPLSNPCSCVWNDRTRGIQAFWTKKTWFRWCESQSYWNACDEFQDLDHMCRERPLVFTRGRKLKARALYSTAVRLFHFN